MIVRGAAAVFVHVFVRVSRVCDARHGHCAGDVPNSRSAL